MKRRLLIALALVLLAVVAGVLVFGAGALRVEVAILPKAPGSAVQPVRFGHSNVFLIEAKGGYLLVDGGMPAAPEKLGEVFAALGIDPKSVRLIVATHGHLDHIGNLALARRLTGAPLAAHRSIAGTQAAGDFEPAVAQNLQGRFMNAMMALLALTGGTRIEGVAPDIPVDDTLDLGPYGVAGRIVATPGHSPGSLAVLLDTGEAVIGDLVRDEGGGRIGLGMYYSDKVRLLESLSRIAEAGAREVYLSHGDRIGRETFRAAISAVAGG